MKCFSVTKLGLALALMLSVGINTQAQHSHLNAGAVGTHQNDPLIWANGAEFIASSGYVKTLEETNAGRYAGYFQQNITLTALPATVAHAGPDPAASALGSFIRARMSCAEAPPGGQFAFWENGATAPTISVGAGESSTNTWPLSENDGSPGSDPYGHIHGRRFTATKAGLYKILFQALDTSTNGVGGAPIHTPSAELPVWFQAGVNVVEVEPDFEEGHVHVRFGARLGYSWQVEASEFLGPQANWESAGAPIIGDDIFIEMLHEVPPDRQRFYRVKGTVIPPP